MVALALAGLVLASAHRIIAEIDDSGKTLADDARRADARANGDRLLRLLVGRAEARPDSLRRFRGDEQAASFDSWCESAGGWLERCRVDLSLGLAGDSSVVTARLSTREAIMLRAFAGPASFRYFGRDSAGTQWKTTWGRSITAPLALGILFGDDTLVVRIGEGE